MVEVVHTMTMEVVHMMMTVVVHMMMTVVIGGQKVVGHMTTMELLIVHFIISPNKILHNW